MKTILSQRILTPRRLSQFAGLTRPETAHRKSKAKKQESKKQESMSATTTDALLRCRSDVSGEDGVCTGSIESRPLISSPLSSSLFIIVDGVSRLRCVRRA